MDQDSVIDQMRRDLLAFIDAGKQLSMDNFSADTKLKDAGIDSFRIIELILFIENKYKLSFPERAYTRENLHSINSILKCIGEANHIK